MASYPVVDPDVNPDADPDVDAVVGPVTARADADVTIRYWASARAAAGCDSECFSGDRVGDVLDAASAAHAGLGTVLEVCTILLDGRPVAASHRLSAGTTLEVLPPFAGG